MTRLKQLKALDHKRQRFAKVMAINFIIATPKGYCLTNKHDQIVKYKRNLEKRRESLTKQLTQIEKNNIYYRNF